MRWPWVPRSLMEAVNVANQQTMRVFDENLRVAQAEMAAVRAVLDAEHTAHRREVADMRAAHAAEIAKLHTTYERVIETQASAQKAAVEHAMNLVNFGMPKRVEAVVEEREPDAATRAARQVTEETIARATEALKHEYAKHGIPVSDEELRAEATTLVTGGRWKAPAALAPFLKD